MSIRIRLARHGQRNAPVYHIVALQAHKPRNARPLEKLGEYDPVARLKSVQDIPMANRIFGHKQKKAPEIVEKRIEWDVERIKWWLGNGAEPTKTVLRLLEQGQVVRPAPPGERWSMDRIIDSSPADHIRQLTGVDLEPIVPPPAAKPAKERVAKPSAESTADSAEKRVSKSTKSAASKTKSTTQSQSTESAVSESENAGDAKKEV